MNLLIDHRAISLFNSAWASSFPSLGGRHHNLALFSKIMSVIFPAIIIGVLQIPFLQETAILHIISTYATSKFLLITIIPMIRNTNLLERIEKKLANKV